MLHRMFRTWQSVARAQNFEKVLAPRKEVKWLKTLKQARLVSVWILHGDWHGGDSAGDLHRLQPQHALARMVGKGWDTAHKSCDKAKRFQHESQQPEACKDRAAQQIWRAASVGAISTVPPAALLPSPPASATISARLSDR